jgi:hypothetical protein
MPRTTFIRIYRIRLFITTICTTRRFLSCVPVKVRAVLIIALPSIRSNSCTTYGCVRAYAALLGEDDGAEEGSQNAHRITLVGGPERSYSAARMGFYVLGGPRVPYGVCC